MFTFKSTQICALIFLYLFSIAFPISSPASFTLADTFIDGSPVLYARTEDTAALLGEPEESIALTVPGDGGGAQELTALVYDNLLLEVWPDGRVLRYDITGGDYEFLGIGVGMARDEFERMYPGNAIYPLDGGEGGELAIIRKLLTDYKPEGCYDGYDSAALFLGGVQPEEYEFYGGGPYQLGAVVLFSGGEVGRIVFGYPSAG